MLISVVAIELLELLVDLRRHLQANCQVVGPVGRLQTLDLEIWGLSTGNLCTRGCCLIFLGLFLLTKEISEHPLHLVHLLHATRDLETCHQKFFELEIFVSFLEEATSEQVSIDEQKEVLVREEAENACKALQLVFDLLFLSLDTTLAQDLVSIVG